MTELPDEDCMWVVMASGHPCTPVAVARTEAEARAQLARVAADQQKMLEDGHSIATLRAIYYLKVPVF